MDNDAPEGTCYICGHGNPDVIQSHHIIPRRYDGTDEGRNIVDLCPSCHDAIERIYDDSFFEELGVEKATRSKYNIECEWRDCTSRDTYNIDSGVHEMFVCKKHRECRRGNCEKIGTPARLHKVGLTILCDEHRVCNRTGCYSSDVIAYNTSYSRGYVFCPEHAAEDILVRDELEISDNETRRDLFRDIRSTIRELQGDSGGVKEDDIIEALSSDYALAAIEEQLGELEAVGEIRPVAFAPVEVKLA